MTDLKEKLLKIHKQMSPAPWKWDCGNWEIEEETGRNHVADCHAGHEKDFMCTVDAQLNGEGLTELRNLLPEIIKKL
jgi:hypothetical protein